MAGLWLLPRLPGFQQAHPGIEIRLAADNRVLDLDAEDIDLAIRYCSGAAAPPSAIRLFGETVVPVAHPALGKRFLRSAADLEGEYLLEFEDLRIPRQTGQAFHPKLDEDSTANRTPVPRETGHLR